MSIPLHPAVVHFPLVLAALLPVVALAAALVVQRGGAVRKTWLPVVLVAAALAASSFVAVRTGEAEEETVEAVVPESAIHEHEERAELFFPLTVALLVLTSVGLAASGRVASVVHWTSVGAALVVAGVGVALGHSGGELVYVHGAGSAYVSGAATGVAGGEDHDEGRHDDDSGHEPEDEGR